MAATQLESYTDNVEAIVVNALAAKVDTQPHLSDELLRLSVDSLAMAELALEIEQKLKIRLDERVLDQNTVGELVNYVRGLVQKQGQRPAN